MLPDLISSHQLCRLIASGQDTTFLVTSPELKPRRFEGHNMPGLHRFSHLFKYTVQEASQQIPRDKSRSGQAIICQSKPPSIPHGGHHMVTLLIAWQGQTGTLIKACLDLKTSLNRAMNQIQLKFNLVK
jgi:hypothetical protein